MTNTNAASGEPVRDSVRVDAQAAPGHPVAPKALTPVRLSEDHARLVLEDDAGVEYSVGLGARLRGILEGGVVGGGVVASPDRPTAREEKQVPTMESALRPRDIQHRVRAGEAPEDLAEIAGMPLERIMNYAAPVLAERAHVAETALAASVRRRTSDPSSSDRTLGAAAGHRLAAAGIDPDDAVEWDAWRRPDNRWTLVATYRHDEEDRRAGFILDLPGKFVIADDDEARWLVGDGRFTSLSRDEDSPLGEDAIELVNPESHQEDSADAAWIAPATPLHRTAQRPPAPAPVQPDPTPNTSPNTAPDTTLETELPLDFPADPAAPVDPGTEIEPADPEPAPESVPESVPEPATESVDTRPAGRGRKGRASVPSWDEIMFGSNDD